MLDEIVLGGKIERGHVPVTATVAKKASGKLWNKGYSVTGLVLQVGAWAEDWKFSH